MSIHEPATLLTDYLLAALAAGLACLLGKYPQPGNFAASWWRRAFWVTAAAATAGGTYHGFAPNLPPLAAQLLWVLTLVLISLTSAAMSLSLVEELAAPARRTPWKMVVAFKLVVFTVMEIIHPIYLVAIVDYGVAMLAWLLAALACRRPWSGWAAGAVGLSLVAALVQQSGWDISPSFNHNDLYHVIQALALGCFYRCARWLHTDRTPVET